MAGEWTTFRLGDVCSKIGSGATPRGGSSVYLEQGDMALIRSQNIYNDGFHHHGITYLTEEHAAELANVEVAEHDVLLNITGDSIARACQVDADVLPARVNQHVAIIRPDPAVLCPRFLRYFLVSPAMQAEMLSLGGAGATRNALTKGMIESFAVLAPADIGEQRAIAHILGTLDDKIELNRRLNETLEAMARALFKSWFVDFDPVRAKCQGRDSGLPKHIADLFPDSFGDSELGEIPKGWGAHRLGDLLSLDKGLSYKGQFLTELGMPMVNLGCFLGRGQFAKHAIKNYSGEYRARHVVRPRDLVLANTDITQKREVIGSPALVPPQGGAAEFLFSHHVYATRFHEGAEPWKLFVHFLLLQEAFRERATGFATGTTVLALPRDAVLELRCPAAPLQVVQAFDGAVLPAVERQWNLSDESQTLAALRDTLVPKLVFGELRVRPQPPGAGLGISREETSCSQEIDRQNTT